MATLEHHTVVVVPVNVSNQCLILLKVSTVGLSVFTKLIYASSEGVAMFSPADDKRVKPSTQPPALVELSEHSYTSASSVDSTTTWKRRKAVRFTNTDDPNDVIVHVKFVEAISDPAEIASMHSSPMERKLYRKHTNDAVQKASLHHQALLLEIHHVFFVAETRGNAERMLRILLRWCQNDEHRGLETIILQPLFRDYSSRLCQQWALFLAVVDSIHVHGKQKVFDDAHLLRR